MGWGVAGRCVTDRLLAQVGGAPDAASWPGSGAACKPLLGHGLVALQDGA
jgi:hypothetical protein